MDKLKDLVTNPGKYAKFYVALSAAVGALLLVMAPIETETVKEAAFVVTPNEWYQVVLAFAGAIGVYQFKNERI